MAATLAAARTCPQAQAQRRWRTGPAEVAREAGGVVRDSPMLVRPRRSFRSADARSPFGFLVALAVALGGCDRGSNPAYTMRGSVRCFGSSGSIETWCDEVGNCEFRVPSGEAFSCAAGDMAGCNEAAMRAADACSASDAGPGGDAFVVPPCTTDDDCDTGGRCVDGHCAAPSACTTAATCAATEVCFAGACIPDRASPCRVHGDCTPGRHCSAARCEPASSCGSDAECDAGTWCDARGTCVPREAGACRDTRDCAGATLCIENRCEALSGTCQFDRECAAGLSCVDAECTRICTATAECLAGDVCIDFACRAAVECTASHECTGTEHCVASRCLPDCAPSPTSCAEGASCATDGFCHPDWAPTPTCGHDTDCDSGRVCLRGSCRTSCSNDVDCLSIDAALTTCRALDGENVCFSADDAAPECRIGADCGDGSCVNARCR